MDFLKEQLIDLKDELLNWESTTDENVSFLAPTTESFEVGGTPLHDPERTRSRGMPRRNRRMSAYEVAQRATTR
ncbi:hypothetical protein ACS0TY_011209 [Phlomoides rotata]